MSSRCLAAPPLTSWGALACREGEAPGPGARCEGCLEEAECTVRSAGAGADAPIPRCAAEDFDPAVRACAGQSCPCWRLAPGDRCQPERDGSPYALELLGPGGVLDGALTARCASATARWGSEQLAALPRCSQRP